MMVVRMSPKEVLENTGHGVLQGWFTRFSLPTKFGEHHHTRFREKDPTHVRIA